MHVLADAGLSQCGQPTSGQHGRSMWRNAHPPGHEAKGRSGRWVAGDTCEAMEMEEEVEVTEIARVFVGFGVAMVMAAMVQWRQLWARAATR